MTLEHLSVPESKEVLKEWGGYVQKATKSQPEESPTAKSETISTSK